jgi:hypothetical protein
VTGQPLDQLHRKTRRFVQAHLAEDEEVVTVFVGRSKQAMVVTDRQLVIAKAGMLAGAGFGARCAAFPLDTIKTINLHAGPGIAALEVVTATATARGKADLRAAYQRPNWLPCEPSIGASPRVAHLRAFVQSGGRAHSARAELSAADVA